VCARLPHLTALHIVAEQPYSPLCSALRRAAEAGQLARIRELSIRRMALDSHDYPVIFQGCPQLHTLALVNIPLRMTWLATAPASLTSLTLICEPGVLSKPVPSSELKAISDLHQLRRLSVRGVMMIDAFARAQLLQQLDVLDYCPPPK